MKQIKHYIKYLIELKQFHLARILISDILLLCLSLSLNTECVCEHQSDHVSREPAPGVRPLCVTADPADLRPAGAGVEGLRCSTG